MWRRAARTAALHVEVLVYAIAARRLLRRRGLEPALHRLGDRTVGWGSTVRGPELVAACHRVDRLIGRGTCLEESVALAALLARHRRQPEIVVGCRLEPDGTWGAHSWVLADGLRFDQAPALKHSALASYSAESKWKGRPLTS
jgi:hypothetical protein